MGYAGLEPVLIDKNIPMPPRRIPQRKFPWQVMQIGDSFVFPSRQTLRKTQQAASSAVGKRMVCDRHDYEVRTVVEKQKDGALADVVRVWRVK